MNDVKSTRKVILNNFLISLEQNSHIADGLLTVDEYINLKDAITSAINTLSADMTKQFCDAKERELQAKINTQSDIITQLRNQISNDQQTLQFNAAFHALDDKIDAIAAKQPSTVPVQWPNLIAVNNTPYNGGFNPWGYGYSGNSYWG